MCGLFCDWGVGSGGWGVGLGSFGGVVGGGEDGEMLESGCESVMRGQESANTSRQDVNRSSRLLQWQLLARGPEHGRIRE